MAPAATPMRVAVVTETYPPEVNGVALTVARMVEGLRARHHDLELVRPRQAADQVPAAGERWREVLLRGMPIPGYPMLRMGMPARRELMRHWSRERPDVVHIATEGPLGWSALRAARALGLPVCSDFRTNFHLYTAHYGVGWLHGPVTAYLRAFHNRTHCTMVPTDALARDLAARGFQRVEVLTRGVDTHRFDPARRSAALREQWNAEPGTLVVTCVGRLAREKNLGLLVEAYRAITACVPDTRLVLVGSGPLEAQLREACRDAIFAGQRLGDDLAAHYASADLFLFPSLTETFGNVVTEAMASGLPIVAFEHAAAAQLLTHNRHGVLVPAGDERAFVDAAVGLAFDPVRRERLAGAARRRSLELGWDSIVRRFESTLLDAARPGSPRTAAPQPFDAPKAA